MTSRKPVAEQRATIKNTARWRLPGTHVATYTPHEIEIVRRYAARERIGHRQSLAHQLAIAIGWYAP